jgi:hypothetical protein
MVERCRPAFSTHPFNAAWAAEGFAPQELLAAADEHKAMLAPASTEVRTNILRGLRSATIIRNEDEEEALASYQLLKSHLADVPADILQEACRRYVNKPGVRYYPRSAGELRAFTGPLMVTRMVREHRLREMAAAAEERERRAREDGEVEWTVERVRALPRNLAAAGVSRGWITQDMFDEAFAQGAEIEGER